MLLAPNNNGVLNPYRPARISVLALLLFAFLACGLSASQTALADGQAGSSYVLHANDQLLITVLGHDDYTKQVTILSDGTFDYPIVGIVPASGLTVKQLSKYLENGLSSEFDQPQVTISVVAYNAPVVKVVGSVGKGGSYTYIQDWHVIDAIAAAGGLANDPDLVTITLVRKGQNPVQLDGTKLMNGSDVTQNPALLPGDTLLINSRDVSSTGVQVSGEVNKPGVYPVPEGGESPLAALDAAGSTVDDAALSQVQLSHNGQVSTIDLRTVNNTLINASSLPTIQQGDILLVPKIAARIAVLGAVALPQEYSLPEDKPLLVSGAITMAKGNSSDADLAKITVSRIVNGKPTAILVDLPKALKGGNQQDIPLQAGDIVYVPIKGESPNDNALLYLLGPLTTIARL